MIQEKFNQRAESYEIENARTKIVNESNRELKEKISSMKKKRKRHPNRLLIGVPLVLKLSWLKKAKISRTTPKLE